MSKLCFCTVIIGGSLCDRLPSPDPSPAPQTAPPEPWPETSAAVNASLGHAAVAIMYRRGDKGSHEATSIKAMLEQHGYRMAHHPLWSAVTDVVPPPMVVIKRLAGSLAVELPAITTGYQSTSQLGHELQAFVSWYHRPRSLDPAHDGCTVSSIARTLGSRLHESSLSKGGASGARPDVAHPSIVSQAAAVACATSGGACDTKLVRDALQHCLFDVVLEALLNNQVVAKLLPGAPRGESSR